MNSSFNLQDLYSSIINSSKTYSLNKSKFFLSEMQNLHNNFPSFEVNNSTFSKQIKIENNNSNNSNSSTTNTNLIENEQVNNNNINQQNKQYDENIEKDDLLIINSHESSKYVKKLSIKCPEPTFEYTISTKNTIISMIEDSKHYLFSIYKR